MSNIKKITQREVVHKKIRKKVNGNEKRPRLSVYRSAKHIYAQIIDDNTGRTLVFISSLSPKVKEKIKTGGNVGASKVVGEEIANFALSLGIKKVVFDRGGYVFHGRVKALAESARDKGLDF
ncbi:MAG: 50S ribosomal protein L18 [bacterium]